MKRSVANVSVGMLHRIRICESMKKVPYLAPVIAVVGERALTANNVLRSIQTGAKKVSN